MTTKQVHISTIRQGDTVIHNNIMKTVSGTDIKNDIFMGTSIFGDSYKIGNKKVTLVDFKSDITSNNHYIYSMKNTNRIYGNNIIVGTKEGITEYYNWNQDKMIADKEQASGYDKKTSAQYTIEQIKNQFPDYTFTTLLDNLKK